LKRNFKKIKFGVLLNSSSSSSIYIYMEAIDIAQAKREEIYKFNEILVILFQALFK
jgi:hypothetical protein